MGNIVRKESVNFIGNPSSGKIRINSEFAIRSKYTQMMYRHLLPGMWTSVFLAGILCLAMWPVGPQFRIAIWFGLITGTAVLRSGIVLLYWHKKPGSADLLMWERWIYWSHFFSALIWGTGAVWIMPPGEYQMQATIFFFLMGLSCGSIGLYIGETRLKALTLAAYLLPVDILFMFSGRAEQVVMAIAALFLLVVMTRGAQLQNQLLKDGLDLAQELMQANMVAEKMARTDPLTGLNNRRAFAELGAAIINQARRNKIAVSAIMMDVDHFKKINDTYGHHVGDAALKHLAEILTVDRRDSDICGRMGGEEFALLLPGSDLTDAICIAENIRQRIMKSSVSINGCAVELTSSFGVACGDQEIDEIIKMADSALFRAKEAGRNKVVG